jgi:hypothetical protein
MTRGASGAPSRRRRLWRALVDRYFTVDPRASGLFRIVFGVFLMLDCLRHWSEIGFLYSNDGVLTNHYHLFKPTSGNGLSVFHAFSSAAEVHVLFAVGLAVHFFYTIGWRTRVFAILSCVWVVSRDTRVPFVENGGYVVQNLLCFWGCFLPLGRRFSVDAWRASLAARVETSLEELAARDDPAGERRPVISMIGLIVIVNLAVVYLFNVVNKVGHLWRRGEAVHYVLHIDRMVTGLGVFVREQSPAFLITAADFGAILVEAFIFVCVASPRARFYTRPLAMLLMAALHATFGTFMRLGPFSWCLICWSVLLLLPVHFERARRFYERRTTGCELVVDPSSPFGMNLARVVARLDPTSRVTLVDGGPGSTLAVRRAAETSHAPSVIYAWLTEALPFGLWVRRLFAIATLGVGPATVRAILARPSAISRFFGLRLTARPEVPSRPLFGLGAVVRVVREGALVYLAAAATYQLYYENKLIPKTLPPPLKEGQELQPDEKWAMGLLKTYLGEETITLKPEPPTIVQITIGYTRTFQGWGMFAPNPIQEDGILVVDAWTAGGRRLDPLTGEPPILDLRPLRGAGLSQLRQDYGNRIRMDRNVPYRDGLRDYLLRYPERTGDAKDELLAFDVYWLRDKCPKPPSNEPYDNDLVPLLAYRKPKLDATARALGIEIPPAPKVRSAEKW